MTKNPLVNAFTAIGYIVIIASMMFYGTQHTKGPDTVFAPIAVLSLLTLSAAVMAYIFFFQPIQLYLDGKKKQAVNLFFQTIAIFAGITFCILAAFFSGALG